MNYKWFASLVFAVLLLGLGHSNATGITGQNQAGVVIICYHDIGDPAKDVYSTPLSALRGHFNYLKRHGYTPISLDDYLAAMRGEKNLPPKPVMLTFDDGYLSFYTKIYPLLKEYNYPAVMSIISSYPAEVSSYSRNFVTWDMLKEMEDSGLVALASHSHRAHRFVPVNPQGDTLYALGLPIYNENLNRYETLAEYDARVAADIRESQMAFEKNLGHKVKAFTWPFGAYTNVARDAAQEAGFEVFFALKGGFNHPGEESILEARRIIIHNAPSNSTFGKYLQSAKDEPIDDMTDKMNAAYIGIDMIYDPASPAKTAENIRDTVNRLTDCGINTVYLQAFSDAAYQKKEVYFYTEFAPVKADIFCHITNALKINRISVYAAVPTVASKWLHKNQAASLEGTIPFAQEDKDALAGLIADLVAHTNVNGVLFLDGLYLSEAEYRSFLQLPEDEIIEFTERLNNAARRYNYEYQSIREVGQIIGKTGGGETFDPANYQTYLNAYDYIIVKLDTPANPAAGFSEKWLESLKLTAAQDKEKNKKIIFQFATYSLPDNGWLSRRQVERETLALRKQGALNIAYCPENVISRWR